MDKPWPRQSLLLLSLGLAFSPLTADAAALRATVKTSPSGVSLSGIGLGSNLGQPSFNSANLLTAPAALLTTPAPGLASPIVTAAPIIQPGAVPTVLPAEQIQDVSAALAPANSDKLSGEQSKGLADSLFSGQSALTSPTDIPGAPSSLPSGLTPSEDPANNPNKKLAVAERLFADKRPGFGNLRERFHFYRIYARTFWWYTHDHIMNMWPDFQKKRKAVTDGGKTLSVPADERRFFAHMRVMGQSGPYYVLGFAPRKNAQVVEEAIATFDQYFTGPGVGRAERDAFIRFMARAREYNSAGRAPSYVRKHIRDALLSASLKSGSELAPYFDSLMKDDNSIATAQFQEGQAAAMLEQFRGVVRGALSEEDASAPDRIVGVVLLGSFASGSPNPKSDFDLQLLTANGTKARMAAFTDKVTSRWTALGRQAVNPVSVHESPYLASKTLIVRVHDGPYLVIGPDAQFEQALSRAPGERSFWMFQRELTFKGRFDRALQFVIVYASSLYADFKARSGR